jgi:broad specificity phosphatase PhoE
MAALIFQVVGPIVSIGLSLARLWSWSDHEPCGEAAMSDVQNFYALFGRGRQVPRSLPPTIFLCRHGETALNATGRLRGLLDPDLGATGRQQAKALATALRPTRPLTILASPLRRTVQTAEAVATACSIPVQLSDDLLDRDYGPLNGRLVREVNETWGSIENAPGVESWDSVLARAQSALALASSPAMDGPVVLVSHDAVNSALLAFLDPTRWPLPSAVPQPTGCLNILQRDRDAWTVVIAGLKPSPPNERIEVP